MRELHWHTSADEWSFFIEGNLRYSVFTVREGVLTVPRFH